MQKDPKTKDSNSESLSCCSLCQTAKLPKQLSDVWVNLSYFSYHKWDKSFILPLHAEMKITACKGNMKESWKAMNELLNKRSKSSSIDCLKESGTETRNKKDVSNAMNNFFCTIGRDLGR